MAQVLAEMPGWEPSDIAAARGLLADIDSDDQLVEALVGTALALGVDSLRAPSLALRVARAAAALDGRRHLVEQDVELAAALVLAPRATRLPAPPPPDESEDESDQPPPADASDSPPPPTEAADNAETPPPEPPPTDDDTPAPLPDGALDDRVLAAAQAAIPAGLLEALQGSSGQLKSASAGRSGAQTIGQRRGRPNGTRRGEPRAGARLNVIETLRAAAPWQTVRRVELERAASVAAAGATAPAAAKAAHGKAVSSVSQALRSHSAPRSPRILVRREDFHINRVKQRTATTTVFVVDASGSSALNRLAEAKGAVELLLADCYVRRDQVAVLAFRGQGCELLLPPTRSLVRAKRSLAGLPGGGGTPLASAIDAAAALGESIARRGDTPVIVLLTDGRGNIARDGSPGRARATEDLSLAARQFRAVGLGALLIDTSPQPVPAARQLALEMGAAYLPLPYAGSSTLSKAVGQAVRTVQSAPSGSGGPKSGTSR
jgi:magnesium chelatase subunit D